MHDNSKASPAATTAEAPSAKADLGQGLAEPSASPPAGFRAIGLFIDFFCSMRLTVACLALALILVFAGTLAQVELGLYKAQNEFFRGFLVYWLPKGSSLRIPVLPGGYLVGGVLMFNLIASHFRRFQFTRGKIGIWLTHAGLILLLLGQLLTDVFSRETRLHLREGETKNYTEADREVELAIVDTTDPDTDTVIAIGQRELMKRGEIRHRELPFALRVKTFYANSTVENRAPAATTPPAATQDIGAQATLKEAPHTTVMDQRDVPSAVVEVVTEQGSLGTWLASEYLNRPQTLTVNGRSYRMSMRLQRFYKPFSLQLLDFRHDLYTRHHGAQELLQPGAPGAAGHPREARDLDLHEQPAAVLGRNLLPGQLRPR